MYPISNRLHAPARHLVGRGRRHPEPAARQAQRGLERAFRTYQPYLLGAVERRFGPDQALELLAASHAELQELAPRVPAVRPGDWLGDNLYGAAVVLAVGRTLGANGFDDQAIATITREAAEGRLDAYPPLALRIVGRMRATWPYQRLLARRAARSRQPAYPGEWTYDRVAGDGRTFAWGIDYRRCPILDFYRAEGAEELMSAVCPLDFTISQRMGDGLVRTTTLASGGDRCNFRYGTTGGSSAAGQAGQGRVVAR